MNNKPELEQLDKLINQVNSINKQNHVADDKTKVDNTGKYSPIPLPEYKEYIPPDKPAKK